MASPQGGSPIDAVRTQIEAELHNEDCGWKRALAQLEAKTGVKREHYVYSIGGLAALYLVVGFFAELVCNFAGFAYPAYASMRAIRSVDKDDDTQWLTYWTIFAVCSLLDFASDKICGWFPIYWLVKCVWLVWLWCPATKGALKVWRDYIGPLYDRYHASVDQAAAQAGSSAMKAAAEGAVMGQEAGLAQESSPSGY